MLSNILLPPGLELPLAAPFLTTPGNGRLYLPAFDETAELLRQFGCAHLSDLELKLGGDAQRPHIWQLLPGAHELTAHIYGCVDFAPFYELCDALKLERVAIRDLACSGDHCRMLLSAHTPARQLTRQLRPLAERLGIDIACIATPPSPTLAAPGMLFMDMDSTLIQCECIDEIADFLGIKAQIAAITQQSMEGKLDFAASFTERVRLLAGLDASVLQQVLTERVQLMPGAGQLIRALHANGWKVGLVSGGFTFFTDHFRQTLKLDFALGNELEIENGKLTGRYIGAVVDGAAKLSALRRMAGEWAIPMSQTVAIGDGANDLPMIEAAGMGIAFHAKPKVRELAPYAVSHGGLERALDLLGN